MVNIAVYHLNDLRYSGASFRDTYILTAYTNTHTLAHIGEFWEPSRLLL